MKSQTYNQIIEIKTFLRYFLPLIITIVLISIAVIMFDLKEAATYLGRISSATLALSFVFVISNLLLSCVRYHLLLCDLGVRQPFLTSFRINILSILSGVVCFNFFGQGLSRAAMLSKEEWSPAIAFMTTSVERAMSLVLLLVMALGGVIWLFGGLSITLSQEGAPLALFVYLVVVVSTVLWFGLRRQERISVRQALRNNIHYIVRVGAITFFMLMSMMLAYVILAVETAPTATLADLLAMSVVVMFASSLPISFSGWGVRELSAGYVFAMIGQSSEAGLAIGLLIGLFSLVALTGLAMVLSFTARYQRTASTYTENRASRVSGNFTRITCLLVPVAAAAAVLFQVRLPTNTGVVNVNLADPIVITGALILILLVVRGRLWHNLWWASGFAPGLGLATAAILLSFLHGWNSFGLIDWALYNRLLGWLVILSYVLTGTMLTYVTGREGVLLMFRVYLVSCASIILAEFILHLMGPSLGLEFIHWDYGTFYGVAGNPNAFGFQLLLAVVIGLSGLELWEGQNGSMIETILLGIVFAGIFFSQSRAAAGTLACLLMILLLLKRLSLKHLAATTGVALLIISASFLYQEIGGVDSTASVFLLRFNTGSTLSEVQPDRAMSIVSGLEMWRDHLVFGAGLGAFMYEQVQKTGVPLVIHNTYLWWLAEFGIVGFLSFMMIPVSVFTAIRKDTIKVPDWAVNTFLGIAVVMGLTSWFHDMAYQRIFWLFLGVVVANSGRFPTGRNLILDTS